jgi:hypothetical protein
METGAYTEALALAQQCISVARAQNLLSWQGLGLVLLGTIYRAMLALDEARVAHLEAFEFYKNVKIPALMQMVPAELCADCALFGSWEDAHMYGVSRDTCKSGHRTIVSHASMKGCCHGEPERASDCTASSSADRCEGS